LEELGLVVVVLIALGVSEFEDENNLHMLRNSTLYYFRSCIMFG
jgi:hypothetical protein